MVFIKYLQPVRPKLQPVRPKKNTNTNNFFWIKKRKPKDKVS